MSGKVSARDILCFVKSYECIRLAKNKTGFGKPAFSHCGGGFVHAMFRYPPPQKLPFASGTACRRVGIGESNQLTTQCQPEIQANSHLADGRELTRFIRFGSGFRLKICFKVISLGLCLIVGPKVRADISPVRAAKRARAGSGFMD